MGASFAAAHPDPRDTVIEVRHLRKQYDDTVALENLSLTIPEGEVFGLIGPNGAGKTTLIRILATLLEPTYGEVRIHGIDALAEPLRAHPLVSYMSDFFSLYEDLLVWEYLDHFAGCYGVAPNGRTKLIDEVLGLVSLEVKRDAMVRGLSRGMRQRLCFARALIHQPKVLLLDEPASGMDPAGRLEFRAFLKQLHAMGRTIIVSSHILTEMTDFCTSIGIMEQGRLLASGRVGDILKKLQPALRLEIEVIGDVERLRGVLGTIPAVERVEVKDNRLSCDWTESKETLPGLHRRLAAEGVDLVSLAVKAGNLEDIYMRIAGHHTS